MKKFIGFYIIGASTQEDAQAEKGLMLWSETKPSSLRRFFCEKLLGIYWVDKERVLEDKGKTAQSENSPIQMQKLKAEKPLNGKTKSPRKNA